MQIGYPADLLLHYLKYASKKNEKLVMLWHSFTTNIFTARVTNMEKHLNGYR
jgi:hypothetical protein